MGLDNGFVGRSKKHSDVEINLAYFRKYYTLNDWVMKHGISFDENNPYEVAVSKDNLEGLLKLIEPIAEALQGYTYNQISYYEDNGYPQEIVEKFYEEDFSPVSTNVAFAGHKLIKLYRSVLCMLEMIEENGDDFYITFYSSF